MRNSKLTTFFILIILFNAMACRKKVKHEYNYYKLSQADLSFVPYHVGDVLNLKDQSSGVITQFTCNYWKIDSTVWFSGCGQNDNVCIRNSKEYLDIVLAASTSDSLFNMGFEILQGGLIFEQNKIYLELRGYDYSHPWADSGYGQIYLDSLISNNKVFKKVNCYYGRRYSNIPGNIDSLYFSSTDGVIRLVLPTENKIFVQ